MNCKSAAWAQAPKPQLAFEVASIHQMNRPCPGMGTRIDGAGQSPIDTIVIDYLDKTPTNN